MKMDEPNEVKYVERWDRPPQSMGESAEGKVTKEAANVAAGDPPKGNWPPGIASPPGKPLETKSPLIPRLLMLLSIGIMAAAVIFMGLNLAATQEVGRLMTVCNTTEICQSCRLASGIFA